ncbi:MAG: tetratricopeptide repeat protein [Parvibaculaceae bacterium]
MTYLDHRQTAAKAIAEGSNVEWFRRVSVISFAVLMIAAALSFATAGRAADEDPQAGPPSEASGHDLYHRGYYEEALAEWAKAVEEQNDPGAAFRLGEEYFDAKVVERDVEKAITYLRIGADGGDPRAQQDLATMYDNGWGVPEDKAMAASLYLAAAQQGSAVAQYNVATMFETGTGVEQDIEKAYMYYLLAVEGGFPHFASVELEKISRKMTAQQIKDATVMARQFEPEPEMDDEKGG